MKGERRYFLTAYGIALKHGFQGSEEEWLESITAYGQALSAGFEGSYEQWLQKIADPVPELTVGETITLEAGLPARVEIAGTKEQPVLNFGIPRGVGLEDALMKTGGTMSGALDMGGYGIHNVPEPKGNADAVPKEYADRALPKSGGTMSGALDMGGYGIHNVPEPKGNTDAVPKEYADRALPKGGGEMTGSLDMGANPITNLADPTQDGDGVNKGYLVRYADSRILQATVQLTAAGWSAAAPYTQTVALSGILPTDRPHYGVVYSGNWEAEKEAFSCVDDLDTAENVLTFTCYEEKPETNLIIQLEVNR